jgi:O-antigen/teichoic acid export membrane protein
VCLLATIVSSCFYYIYILYHDDFLQNFLLIQSIALISVSVDISWFFIGVEEFKKISIRNFIFKSATVISVFLFVRSSEDIYIYMLILLIGNLICQAVMWKFLLKYLDVKNITITKIGLKKHLIGNIKFFILSLSIQIYQYFDKIIIGYTGNVSEITFYDFAQKLVRFGLIFSSTLSSVVMPRVSNLLSQKNHIAIKTQINRSLYFSISVSMILMFGIICVAKGFINWYLGEDYIRVAYFMIYLSPILIIVPIGNVLGMQLMVPMRKELLIAICPIVGCIVNIIVNILLTLRFYGTGAIIACISTELAGTILTCFFARKYFNSFSILKGCYKVMIASIIMSVFVISLYYVLPISPVLTISQIILGCVILAVVLYYFKENIIFDIVNIIKKLKKHKS